MPDNEIMVGKCPAPGLPPSASGSGTASVEPAGPEPDARLVLCSADGDIVARCSLWWRHTPQFRGRAVGFIGHYEAYDPRSAATLLHRACRQLARNGRSLAVGPVDGNTWMSYRHVVETSDEPPFFLEPLNPPDWPAQFKAAGFAPLAFYRSSVQHNLCPETERLNRANVRLHEMGVRIRVLDGLRIDEEMQRIHALSLECFSGSLLFSPISFDAFIARYRAILQHVDPELVMLAEHRGRLVGYLFAVPDAFQATRGEAEDTVIVKTIAVSPEHRFGGLGHVLAMHGASQARALGYKRAIHALMQERKGSANWSTRLARPIRRYALFSRALDELS